jgi:hypothetical protein
MVIAGFAIEPVTWVYKRSQFKGKKKQNFFPHLFQHHAKKTRVGLKILNLGTKCSWVVSSMPWPFYSRQCAPSGIH